MVFYFWYGEEDVLVVTTNTYLPPLVSRCYTNYIAMSCTAVPAKFACFFGTKYTAMSCAAFPRSPYFLCTATNKIASMKTPPCGEGRSHKSHRGVPRGGAGGHRLREEPRGCRGEGAAGTGLHVGLWRVSEEARCSDARSGVVDKGGVCVHGVCSRNGAKGGRLGKYAMI